MELYQKEVERFKSSRVWKEITRIQSERREGLKDDLCIEGDIDQMRILQGRIAEINDFLELPDLLLEEIKAEEELNSQKLGD
jgi:hypothetical protein